MKPEDKTAWLQACNEFYANSGGKDLGEYMFEAGLAHRDAQPAVAVNEQLLKAAIKVNALSIQTTGHKELREAIAAAEAAKGGV